jgi:hypothetical protein
LDGLGSGDFPTRKAAAEVLGALATRYREREGERREERGERREERVERRE